MNIPTCLYIYIYVTIRLVGIFSVQHSLSSRVDVEDILSHTTRMLSTSCAVSASASCRSQSNITGEGSGFDVMAFFLHVSSGLTLRPRWYKEFHSILPVLPSGLVTGPLIKSKMKPGLLYENVSHVPSARLNARY